MWTAENRARYTRDHLRYCSDMTDEEWALIEPLIPLAKKGGDKRRVNLREVTNAIMYVLSTGCQWRSIPKDFPPRSTIYDDLDLFEYEGVIDRMHHALYVQCREVLDREASSTTCVIDSQSVKSAEKGGPRSTPMVEPVLGPAKGWTRGTRGRKSKARSGTSSSIRKAC